jgi:LacI family repressor for deo operon, udp, cdd, tsx, nupC, and nupG
LSNSSPATIEDVARIAEVSIATVSRAIHNPEKVANSTRLKVNQAIAITGYTTNAMARSLRLGRSNMILVVAPDIGDPNFSNILVGLENEARAHGYGILIGHTQNDAQRGLEYLKFLNSNQAAGLILFTGILPFGHQAMTARLPPCVGVFEPVFNGGIPYVGVDDIVGARKAVDLLIAEGHTKIAFIGDSRTRLAYGRRRMGYEAGLDAAEQLFVRDTLPTAFMCVNDQTAIGVMLGLFARGYDIPRDFSVTGFDDVPQAVFMQPTLTTIRQPRTLIGKHAMALLLDLLGDGEPPESEILLMPDLVVRNSVSGPSRQWMKR